MSASISAPRRSFSRMAEGDGAARGRGRFRRNMAATGRASPRRRTGSIAPSKQRANLVIGPKQRAQKRSQREPKQRSRSRSAAIPVETLVSQPGLAGSDATETRLAAPRATARGELAHPARAAVPRFRRGRRRPAAGDRRLRRSERNHSAKSFCGDACRLASRPACRFGVVEQPSFLQRWSQPHVFV